MLDLDDVIHRTPGSTPMRVLVAEDSQAVVDRLYDLLREVEGIELAGHAAAVRETYRLIDELHPDILILDLQLLDGSGFHLVAAIKQSHPRSAVIVLTNSVGLPVREKCIGAGADYFLDKSNEFESLPQIVRTIVLTARAAPKHVLAANQDLRPNSAGLSHQGDGTLHRLA